MERWRDTETGTERWRETETETERDRGTLIRKEMEGEDDESETQQKEGGGNPGSPWDRAENGAKTRGEEKGGRVPPHPTSPIRYTHTQALFCAPQHRWGN